LHTNIPRLKRITHLCTRLTLISTDKGFKGFEFDKKVSSCHRHHKGVCAAPISVIAFSGLKSSHASKFYRVFHGMAFPISAAAQVMARRVAA
jgi:hypothetical protein